MKTIEQLHEALTSQKNFMKAGHTIYIEASPDIVWAVTTDVEKWAEWTPTIETAKRVGSEPLGPGSKVWLKQPMQPGVEWTVTKFEPGRLFAWETRRRGLHITAVHEIAPQGGGSENRLSVEMKGTMAILLRPLLKLAVNKALADENNGLKARCEENDPV
jgi:uncharacterized protein YndB with AHSA1/START domain